MKFIISCYWQEYPEIIHPKEEGHGDCRFCVAGPDNIHCKGFSPVRTIPFEFPDDEQREEEDA